MIALSLLHNITVTKIIPPEVGTMKEKGYFYQKILAFMHFRGVVKTTKQNKKSDIKCMQL